MVMLSTSYRPSKKVGQPSFTYGALKTLADSFIGIIVGDEGTADKSAPFKVLSLGKPVNGSASLPSISVFGSAPPISKYRGSDLRGIAPIPIVKALSVVAVAAPVVSTAAATTAGPSSLPLDPCPGARVLRGRSWAQDVYGDQDGGIGGLGTVVGIAPGGDGCWWTVTWDEGGRPFSYRWIPSAGIADLAMATNDDLSGKSPARVSFASAKNAVALRKAADLRSAAEAAAKEAAAEAASEAAAAEAEAKAAAPTSVPSTDAPSSLLHPKQFGIGATVRRGIDWSHGNGTSKPNALGTVDDESTGFVSVVWEGSALSSIVRYSVDNDRRTLELVSAPASTPPPRFSVGDLVQLRDNANIALNSGSCLGMWSQIAQQIVEPAIGVVTELLADGCVRIMRASPQPDPPSPPPVAAATTSSGTVPAIPYSFSFSSAAAAPTTSSATTTTSSATTSSATTVFGGFGGPSFGQFGSYPSAALPFGGGLIPTAASTTTTLAAPTTFAVPDDPTDLSDARDATATEVSRRSVDPMTALYYRGCPLSSVIPTVALLSVSSIHPFLSGRTWPPGQGFVKGCKVRIVDSKDLKSNGRSSLSSKPDLKDKICTISVPEYLSGSTKYAQIEEHSGTYWELESFYRIDGFVDMEDNVDSDLAAEAAKRRQYAALSTPLCPGDLVAAAASTSGAALDGIFRILSTATCSFCKCASGGACACDSCDKGAKCEVALDAIRIDSAVKSTAIVRVSSTAVARVAGALPAPESRRAGPVFKVGDAVRLSPRVKYSSRCLGDSEDGTVGVVANVSDQIRGIRVAVNDETDSYDWTELLLISRGSAVVSSASGVPPLTRAPSMGTPDDELRALRESVDLQGSLLNTADKHRVLGESLFKRVLRVHPKFAGKITGCILDTNDADEILKLLESTARDSFRALVRKTADAIESPPDEARPEQSSVFRSSAGGALVRALSAGAPRADAAVLSGTSQEGGSPVAASVGGASLSGTGGGASVGGAEGASTFYRPLRLKELVSRVDGMGNSAAHYAAFLNFPRTLAALEAAGASPFSASADPGWTPRSITAGVLTRRAAALHRDLTLRPTSVGSIPGALAAACRAAAAHCGEDGRSRCEEAAWTARWDGGADDENLRAGIAALRAGDVDDAIFYCNEAVNTGVVDALPYLALSYSAANNVPLVRVCVINYIESFKTAAAHAFDPTIFFVIYENDAPKGRVTPPRYVLQRSADGLRALRHFDAVANALLQDPSRHTLDSTIPLDAATGAEDAFDEETAADIFDEEAAATDPEAPEVLWEELRAAPDSRPCPALSKIMKMTGLKNVKNMALNLYMTITMREMLKRVHGGAAVRRRLHPLSNP
jgi:hypothetical protein